MRRASYLPSEYPQTSDKVLPVIRKILFISLTLVLVGCLLGWLAYSRSCGRKNAVFAAQVELMKHDAQTQLKIGTPKDDLLRFFTDHNMHVVIQDGTAYGGMTTSGCGPIIGCGFGTSRAFIQLRVEVDEAGSVKSDPVVRGMYTDCL